MRTPKTLAGLLAAVLLISPTPSLPSSVLAQSPEVSRVAKALVEFLGGARKSERAAEVARVLRGDTRDLLPPTLEEQMRGVSEAELLAAMRAIDAGTADQLQKALASLPALNETITRETITRAAEVAANSKPIIGDRVTPLMDARQPLLGAESKLEKARAREPGDLCRLELACQVREIITDVEEAMTCEDSACVAEREALVDNARKTRLKLEWDNLRREYDALDRTGTAMDIGGSGLHPQTE